MIKNIHGFNKIGPPATMHKQVWQFCKSFSETGWQELWPHKIPNLPLQISFYGVTSKGVYNTIKLTVWRKWIEIRAIFKTLITTFLIRWHTAWWNEWIPAFGRGAANFDIYCTKSGYILKQTSCICYNYGISLIPAYDIRHNNKKNVFVCYFVLWAILWA